MTNRAVHNSLLVTFPQKISLCTDNTSWFFSYHSAKYFPSFTCLCLWTLYKCIS